eukprot:TRINITY_DN7969_c0_g1_i1.p1 TRINITY_DN7969_c0_g1~~TRINITY_DN7969_c0_g1_i1.p1  ORF type:complete len:236 (+),score=55.42 TRINITY_DN7969_c0_g1_i1:65-772(+)
MCIRDSINAEYMGEMGNAESGLDKGLQQFITTEYDKARKDKSRDYLRMHEIFSLQSPEDFPFSFAHLGTLYVVDADKDGRVTLEELLEFGLFCMTNLRSYKTYEFQSQLQAATTLKMWESIKRDENGLDDLVAWIGRMLYENSEVFHFEMKPGIVFIKVDTVMLLFELCNLKVMNGMDLQSFFFLLQECGEEAGLTILDCDDLEEYVPLQICQEYMKEFMKGFTKLMREIGFETI